MNAKTTDCSQLERGVIDPETADEVTRATMRKVSRDGKLTPQGQRLAKLLDRVVPDEKVDEWGWNLSRRERAAIKRRAAEKRAADETRRRGAD